MIIAASPLSQLGLVLKLGKEDRRRVALPLVYRRDGFSPGGLKQGKKIRAHRK